MASVQLSQPGSSVLIIRSGAKVSDLVSVFIGSVLLHSDTHPACAALEYEAALSQWGTLAGGAKSTVKFLRCMELSLKNSWIR